MPTDLFCRFLVRARFLLKQPTQFLTLCLLNIGFVLCRLILSKYTFRKTINVNRMSNNLEPDQAWQNARPDLVPNCLQRLSADDTSRYRVKDGFYYLII